MLVVRLEIWPHDGGPHREIGRAIIANVGGDETVGQYEATVSCPPDTPVRFTVSDYPRSLGAWALVKRVLDKALLAIPSPTVQRGPS